jgi:hypothetical protein
LGSWESPLDDSGKPTEGGPNIIGNQRIEVAAIGDRARGLFTALKSPCTPFFPGSGSPSSIRIDGQTLSTVEQAARAVNAEVHFAGPHELLDLGAAAGEADRWLPIIGGPAADNLGQGVDDLRREREWHNDS